MTEIDPEAEIEQTLVGLLARREHSRRELVRKLQQRGYREEEVVGVIDRLAGQRLQSDARFAESYARQRQERGYGPIRIAHELRERGVAEEDVSQALAALDVDWWEQACRVRRKRFGPGAPADMKERARQQRFLGNRGFDHDQCRYALGGE